MNYDKKILQDLDLTIEATRHSVIFAMQKYIKQDNQLECWRIEEFFTQYYALHPEFAEKNPTIYKELDDLRHECWWIALPVISEDKALACYEKNINIACQLSGKYEFIPLSDKPAYWYNYFFWQKLENRFTTYLIPEDRDRLKNKLMDILKNNEELISKERLIYSGQSLKPTLANWFLIYFDAVGTGEINKLKLAQFYTTDKNFRKLALSDQEKLRIIFKLYEQCKISSTTIVGYETPLPYEDEKGVGYAQYGQIIRDNKEDINYFNNFIKENKTVLKEGGYIDETFLKPKEEREETIKNINDTNKMLHDYPTYINTDEPKGVAQDIFSNVDEQEIAQHQQKAVARQVNEADYAKVLSSLKQQFTLKFTDPEQESRFDNLALSYLKGLKDIMEFKEMLTRPSNVGGLNYHMDLAEQLAQVLKGAPVAVTSSAPAKAAPDITQAAAPLPSFDQLQAVMNKPQPVAAKTTPPRTAPPPLRVISSKNPVPKAGGAIPQVKRLNPSKPIVQDIRTPMSQTKLVGPIEELGSIDLKKFRKSAQTPFEAAEKIITKINLLEEQSFTEKAKAIVAFKNSPLNKIYLKIGSRSIEEGRPVTEVINEMLSSGEAVLTKEEFDIIADLNRKLRF